ncbi:MAG: DUF134 domain-containing protein [Lachnospiraceae bacterium]|nr:DUF134 domain-containing protein [Lachnospiraceae bacterium]
MPRPVKSRRVCMEPEYTGFLPDGIASGEDIILTVDEYEVIRLVDMEKKTHVQTAGQMGISKTTVTEAVAAYIAGKLDYNPDVKCSHHEHGEGHSCGEHSCGEDK